MEMDKSLVIINAYEEFVSRMNALKWDMFCPNNKIETPRAVVDEELQGVWRLALGIYSALEGNLDILTEVFTVFYHAYMAYIFCMVQKNEVEYIEVHSKFMLSSLRLGECVKSMFEGKIK